MDRAYAETVRLLLDVAPEVFRGDRFAMKGGTAINLFVQNMPRLSVDIDVAYTDWTKPRDEALTKIAEELRAITARLEAAGLATRTVTTAAGDESRIVVSRSDAQVKIETNLVFRGTVRPVERRALCPLAEDRFATELALPTLAVDELYGSKLVAAMDRQHPRDLFDVLGMIESVGLTTDVVECFVTYLAGHNRPMHEVLFPRAKDIRTDYEASFLGLTTDEIGLDVLLETRERLFEELPQHLTTDQRAFLISLARAEPDWLRLRCPHADQLPALRWRLMNLERFRDRKPDEFERQANALAAGLAR